MKEVWRKSKISTAVVSNKPVDDQVYGSEDVKHYGGYLVAESVAPSRVNLISSAPEMYEALKAARIWAGTILALYPTHVRDGGNVRDDVAAIDDALAKADGKQE